MIGMIDRTQWFWLVAGNEIYSSSQATVVAGSDEAYRIFIANGNRATDISSWSELYDVIKSQAPGVYMQSTAAFNSHIDELTPQQGLDLRLSLGLTVISASDTSLNGRYSVTEASQAKITAIASGISNNKGLPNSAPTIAVEDADGNLHTYAADKFLELGTVMRDYIYNLNMVEGTLLAGHQTTWPNATAQIS